MRQTATRILILLLLSTTWGFGQQMWPGDANNNGIVNSVDLLYWGVAYGATGTPRVNPTIDWTGQNINSMWPESTPNGINFVYVDADGNGVINDSDRAGAMENNIGQSHGPVSPDHFEIGYEINGDTRIRLFPSESTISPGNELHIGINIGRSDIPVDSFYGVAFHLSYNPDYIQDGSVEFDVSFGSWISNFDPYVKSIVHTEDAIGFTEVGITRTDHVDILGGYGPIGMLRMKVENMTDNQLPAYLSIKVDSVKLITTSMQTIPVALDSIFMQITNNPVPIYCPNILDPVCGSNGVIYINSCYAEQAGIYDYTSGVCNPGCIDPSQIDPLAVCPTVYEPVCGCNGVTYLNACVAEAAGVINYSAGPCNDNNCYDATLVLTSDDVAVNTNTGTITINCPDTNDPVCGCNGVTYDNPCLAEANGITSYTQGACDNACVDPSTIDPDANCTNNYNPVCGCNGVTYPNACYADAAGVMTYTSGTCGGSSTWCNEAVPIQCGDFLPNETTVGAGNNIITFPGCSGYTFYGPDKVYVINKTTAGDLQIGLEIVTPGLDLDMFLLADNCSQTTCLRSSTTSNNITNNEGILYEDAPIGIYYLVVDGQFASSQGEYHLEVNCGYLYCGDAQALTCGEPFNYNNMHGHDDVSLYGCDGNIYNVENNGPEIVHHFTITEAGPVNISLTNLNDNLELFLLRSCDRGDCMDYSQNAGIENEHIAAYLDPGTYYVVVDGYNGGVSDYTLEVDCTSNCNFDWSDLSATQADCGQNNGAITLVSSSGQPGFLVHWSGPISGSFTTFSNSCTIYNLPPGTYSVTKTDANGCSITGTITIQSIGDFSLNVNEQPAVCGESGSIAASFSNGTGPYHVYLTGPSSTNFNTLSTNINISDLPPGTYQLFVTDDLGCVVSEMVTVGQSPGSFSFDATPYAASCGAPGSMFVVISNGSPPYNIILTGPEGENMTTTTPTFTMTDLPGGTYTLTIEDNNSCRSTEVVSIVNSGLVANVTPFDGICGNLNAFRVDIPNGNGPFIIGYDGPITGQAATGNSLYTVQNLPNGTYAVTVEDVNGCNTYEVIQVQNSNDDLETALTAIHGNCGSSGSVWIDLNTGLPPYSIQWSGPTLGNTSTNNDGINIPNLLPGHYTFSISDNSGCNDLQSVTIQTSGGVNMSTSYTNGVCGALGTIQVNINSGAADYILSWDGPESGIVTINSDSYDIMNMPSGTYQIIVTDANGCMDTETVSISNAEGDLEIIPIAIGGWCNYGRIWLDINGGVLPFFVEWEGAVSGSTTIDHIFGLAIQNLPTSTYFVQVTDANGCVVNQVVNIENDAVLFDLLPVHPSCVQDGSITVQIMDGDPNYTIEWVGPVSGSTTTANPTYVIPNLPAGTYSVTVTDNTLCSILQSIAVIEITEVSLEPTPINGVCGQNGAIWLDINNGSPDFTVNWTGPVNGSTTIDNDGLNIPNLPSGIYTVSVLDANGCTDSESVSILNTEDDLGIVPTPINGICGQFGAIWLDISGGTADYTISWTGPESGSVTISDDGYNIPNLPSGSYNVQITDINGCDDVTNVVINNTEDDLAMVPTPIHGICGQNGAIWLDITGGTADYTISWLGPVNGTTSINNDGYNIPNLPTGTYTIQISDVNGCNDVASVYINNQPDDLTLVPTPINGICGQNGSIWLDINGGTADYTINWTGPANGSITINNDGYNIPNLPSGDYTVEISDINGCDDVINVNINNHPDDLTLVPTPINGVCGQNGDIWLDINGGTADYTISWTGPSSGSETINSDGYNIPNLPSGTYAIQITDINGCDDNISVDLNNLPHDLVVTPVPNHGVCDQPGNILIGISGGLASYTIEWTGPVNGSTSTSNNAFDLSGLPSGIYTIQITDANGCVDAESVNINNIPDDLDLVPTPINGVCGQNGDIWLDINGGTADYTISWTGPSNGSATISSDGYNIPNLPSGTYDIQITDINGCDDNISVGLNNLPDDLSLVATPINGVCGENGSIGLDINGGTTDYNLSWTGPVNGMITINNNAYNVPNLPAGNYSFQVTDSNGCTRSTNAMVAVTATPSVNVNSPVICEGDDIELTANTSGGTGPYTYLWSTGGTAASIIVSPVISTTFEVTITDANGCTANTSALVDVFYRPVITDVTSVNPTCGDNNGSITFVFPNDPDRTHFDFSIDGGLTYPYYVEDDIGSFTVNNLANGLYNLWVRWGNDDCPIDLLAVNLANENGPSVTATPTNGLCGANGSIHVNWSGGAADYTLSWDGPSSGGTTISGDNHTIPDLASGVYTISLTDANGCDISTSATVNNSMNDLGVILSANHGVCGQNGSIQVTVTGGTADYMISWTGPSSGSTNAASNSYNIPNLANGTYTINVSDVNGCNNMATATVNNQEDDLALSTTITNALCTQSGAISLEITGGSPDYLISWTGPSDGTVSVNTNNYTIPNLIAGNYSIAVTDVGGCDQTTAVNIDNLSGDLVVTPTATNGLCGQEGSIWLDIVGGVDPYLINWTGPEMGAVSINSLGHNIPDLSTGIYTFTITDFNGCNESFSVELNNQTNDIVLGLTSNNGACTHLGSIDVSVIGATMPYTINWTGPSSGMETVNSESYNIPNLADGTYSISITDADGCLADDSAAIVNVDNDLGLTLVPNNGICGGPGSFTVTVSGGSPNYTYNWTGPSFGMVTIANTSHTVTNAQNGVYTVNVTDENGCTQVATVTINNMDNLLDANASVTNGLCGQTGSITVTINTGSPSYLITWTGPTSGSTLIGEDSYIIDNLTTGSYNISVTDATGCDVAMTRLVANGASDLFSLPTLFPGGCGEFGEIVVDIVGGTAPYTIAWTGTDVGTTTINDNSYSIQNLATGNYNITVTDVNGCSDIDMESLNNIPDNLDLVPLANHGICGALGSITLNIFGGTPFYDIDWTGPTSGSTTINLNLHSLDDLPSGFYTISVLDANGCEETQSVTINNQESELQVNVTPESGVCGEEGTIQLSISGGTPDYTINWTGPESGMETIIGNSFDIQNLSSGSYSISITDASGCQDIRTADLNNTENDLDAVTSAVNGGCFSLGHIWVDISGGSGPYTINWTGPEAGTQTISDISNGFTISDLITGVYNINVQDINGCTDAETATVNNLENDLAIGLSSSDGICDNLGAIQLNISGGEPNYVINWSGPVNGNTTSSNTNFNIPDLPGGTYTVAVTDENGCTETETTTITVSEGDLSVVVTPLNGGCQGNGIIWVDVLGGSPSYTISWTGPSSGSTTTDQASLQIPNLPTGTYQITVRDDTGCEENGSANIDNTANLLSVSAIATNGICGPSGTIDIDIIGGNPDYLVSWSGPVSGMESISNNFYTLSNLPSGTYTIVVMDSGGCVQITSATVDNDESGDLEIVVNVLPGGCGELGSIWINIYNGDPHFIITWIGPTSGNITTLHENYDVFLPDGEYEITVLDANGCIASQIIAITSILDDLEVAITPMNGQCNDNGSIGIDITGGTPDYTISWENDNTSGSTTTSNNYYEISDLTSGNYTISITDSEGCTEIRYVPIANQNNGFTLSAVATPEDCAQEGAIALQITGGVPLYNISWTGPESGIMAVPNPSYTIQNLTSGIYNVSVTDDNNCSATYQVEVAYDGQNPIADFTASESGLNVTFTNYSTTGTYLWDFGDGNMSTESNPVHSYSSGGSYGVCLTADNGCGSDMYCATVNVTIPPDAVLLQTENMSGASGTTVQVPVTVSNLDMLVSLAGSVEIIDPNVGLITGLMPAIITPFYNADLQTFNFYDNTGTGISVNNGDTLFYINVMLTGNAGDLTQIALTNNPLMIEVGSMENGQPMVMSHVSLQGDLSITGINNLAGAITTFWGDGIPNVEVDISTDAFSSMEMTDDFGNYDLPDLLTGEMYYVEPELDTLPANGLSTFALFIGQRFILGLEPEEIYSPYQIIAGDANCNGAFTTLDLFIIQQLIIGVSEEFANCPSWVFVAQHNNDMPIDFTAYNVFPYIDVDTLMLMQDAHSDFVGVKVGDILGAANPDQFAEEEIEERNSDELYLTMENRAVAPGELVEFEFRSSNFTEIVSYQMSLSFDSERLSFAEFIPGPNPELSNVIAGTNAANEGALRISWFNLGGNASTINDDEVLFTVRAYAQEAIDDLEGLFAVNSRYLRSEAHNGNTEPMDIVLELEESTATSTSTFAEAKYELYQNVPNPFTNRTFIGFDLPEDMDVELTIHDNTGRVLKRLDGHYTRGYNRVEVKKGDLESGVYYYTLKTSTYSATKNMVIFE